MKFTSALACIVLSVLPSFSQASPIDTRQTGLGRFLLKTQVYAGGNDCGTNKDGLYLFSYHTGAGLGVAAAQANVTNSWFELNGTTLLWNYTNNAYTPWPVSFEYGAYQAFNPLSISIAEGEPTAGWFTNSSGLQSNQSSQGWIACDWWLESPQIFSLNGYSNQPIPSSCSYVNLLPEYLPN